MRNVVLGQRYRILDRLGEGGMANVYRALDEKLGRYVAVKILHDHLRRNPDIRSRFQQEAQAVSTLDHPNIMRIYDFSGPEHEQLWLVAELVSGTTLASMQQGRVNQRFPEITAACIIREICRALEHAHKSGIVHRDIKPENVMVTGDGRLKLMDFGIAKDTQRHRKTQTGMFMGSPSYMSPEQVKGKNVDARSDIFSLGVLFYELLTGRLPFEAASSADVIVKITAGEFVYPRFRTQGLSRECDRLVVRCMQKNPESRFQSTTELGNAIDNYLATHKIFSSALALESFISTGSSPGMEIQSDSAEIKTIEPQEIASGEAAVPAGKKTKIRTLKPRPISDQPVESRPQRRTPAAKNPERKPVRENPGRRRAYQMPVPPVRAYHLPHGSHSGGNSFVVIAALLLAGVMAVMWFVDPSTIRSYFQPTDTITDRSYTPRTIKPPRPSAPQTTPQTNPQVPQQIAQQPAQPPTPTPAITAAPEPATVKTPRGQPPRRSQPVATRRPITARPAPSQDLAINRPPVNPAPVTPPGKGRISVTSQPAAEIFVNDQKVGTTIDAQSGSGWIAVGSGKLTISLRRPGYRNFTKQMNLAPDEKVSIGPVNLEKLQSKQDASVWKDSSSTNTRVLTIATNNWPANVTILLPGESMRVFKQFQMDKGTLPVKVPGGKILVRVEANGEVKERTIDLTAINGPLTYAVEFSRAKGSRERGP